MEHPSKPTLSRILSMIDGDSIGRIIVQENDNYIGGLNKLVWALEPLAKAVMTIGGAIGLTLSLFTTGVPAGSNFAILNNPLFLTLIVAALLAVTFFAPVLANKAGSFWSRYTETAGIGDRYRYFYGSVLAERFRALDARMYRQDRFAETALSKESFFSPGSQLAKWAKGQMGSLYAASGAVSQIFTGAAYLFVCLKALGGAFGIGSVTQYVASITSLSGGISGLVENLGKLRNNAPFLQKVFEFLDTPNEMYQGSLTVAKRSIKSMKSNSAMSRSNIPDRKPTHCAMLH